MGTVYALLIGVGQYDRTDIEPLPYYAKDISLMRAALFKGLNMELDNIKICGNNGTVLAAQFARNIKEFAAMIQPDDTFIMYFSGHGSNGNLVFSDQLLNFQSVIGFVDRLAAKNKIMIIDCCQAGAFETAGSRKFSMDDTVDTFAGRGYAVMASSSADAPSHIHPGFQMSLYTSFLVAALVAPDTLHSGRKTLAEINELVVRYARLWSEQNQNHTQCPVYRSSLGGTIFFDVEPYTPYQTHKISFETDRYIVSKVDPLHSQDTKRLAVEVILKQKYPEQEVIHIVQEIRNKVLYADVYSNIQSERKFKGKPSRMVKCFIGYDKSDLINRRFALITTWVDAGMDRAHWYPTGKDKKVIEDTHLLIETSYEMIRRIQAQETSTEEYRELLKPIMADIISMAEEFITFFHEFQNQTISDTELAERYGLWYGKITKLYLRLSDLPMEPDELHGIVDEMYTLAGAVHDFSIIYNEKNMKERTVENREWLLQDAIKRYYRSLDKMQKL